MKDDAVLNKATMFLLDRRTLVKMYDELARFARDLCTDIGSEAKTELLDLERLDLLTNDLKNTLDVLNTIQDVINNL